MLNRLSYAPNKATIKRKKLIFEETNGFDRALAEGFFFVRIPCGLDLASAKKFALNFYKPKNAGDSSENIFRGYSGGPNALFSSELFQNGYIDRENNQAESLYLRPQDLAKFPKKLVVISKVMNIYSRIVLTNFLQHIKIPENIWTEATAGCLDQDNFVWGFNHYRTEKEKAGTVAHKDSGWVTVLYSEEPGLNAFINDRWVPIHPVPGYFTVNFGALLDVLTKDCKPTAAHASLHRVDQQIKKDVNQADRFSVGLFLQPLNELTKVYTYNPLLKGLTFLKAYQEFLSELVVLYDSEREDLASYSSRSLAATRHNS